MVHIDLEDLEHPRCAEGLFSRSSVSVCFLPFITEEEEEEG